MPLEQIASGHVASCIALAEGTGIGMEVGNLISAARQTQQTRLVAVSVAAV